MSPNFKSNLKSALNRTGFDDWSPRFDIKHLDRPRQRPVHLAGQGRTAGVLLLVFPNSYFHTSDLGSPKGTNHEAFSIVLTRRREDLSSHPGQISLPGGRQDAGETLEQTALRETHEEIGVPQNEIEILAELNPVYIPPSDFTVTPFVGWAKQQPRFVAERAEVAEIIQVSLAELCDPATFQWGDLRVDNRDLYVPFYAIQDHQVWGATAIMLSEFIERLSNE